MSVNAFIAIDKPVGISSFGVISALRKITSIRKIGHTGTLDPFATGLLICCIGAYTRLASFIEAEDKCYEATVQLGQKTATGDTEGEVIETAEVKIEAKLLFQLPAKALQIQQLPIPAYSAVKVNGVRAYKLARRGEAVQIPSRPVKISEFAFIPNNDGGFINATNQLSYRCQVSKGTYIRSLSEWLALQLSTVGHTIQLRRTSIGKVDISQAVALDNLTSENWSKWVLPPRLLLSVLPNLELNAQQYQTIGSGGDIASLPRWESGQQLALYHQDALVAIGTVNSDFIHPGIVLL